jgi:glycine cleavage system H protein
MERAGEKSCSSRAASIPPGPAAIGRDRAPQDIEPRAPPVDVEGCPLPEDRKYDVENDVWVLPGMPGTPATLGVLASLTALAGRFTAVRFRAIGDDVRQGQSVATVESVRFTGPVRVPVDGRIVERNSALTERPKLLNDSPYDRGWIVRFVPAAPDTAFPQLESAEGIRERVLGKIRELHIRCYPAAPDVEMYEIGSECSAVLVRLNEEVDRRAADEVILLVSDDPTSPIEMERWSDRTGHAVEFHRAEGTLHHFLVRKLATPAPLRRGADGRLVGAG